MRDLCGSHNDTITPIKIIPITRQTIHVAVSPKHKPPVNIIIDAAKTIDEHIVTRILTDFFTISPSFKIFITNSEKFFCFIQFYLLGFV